jgi:NAD(P)-dependent dehydrogenase (short-subunit alcohol dehydrogenase family)
LINLGSQVVLITGGSRGIGAATVRAAVAAGAAVGFSFLRDAETAAALIAELRAQGARVHAVQGDVADAAFPAHCFDAVQAQLGPVTALVNNAGITGLHGEFVHLPLEVMHRTLQVNVLGTMMLAQEAVRRWRAAAIAGRMVNISSAAATLGSPQEYVHYAASKGAIDAFTIGLGKELAAEGIRVNAVAPGTAMTDIHAAGGVPDRPARVVGRIPLKRIAEPAEIANAVLWLLSDEASYVTGTVLRVAGGL